MTVVVNILAVIGGLTVLALAATGILGWLVARDIKRREFGQ